MTADSPVAAPPAPLDHAAIRSIILGILLAMFLAALDQTIVATALPTIGRELGDLEHLPWVVTAYLLTATAVDAALRQAQRHPRPARDAADRHRASSSSARSPARSRPSCWS